MANYKLLIKPSAVKELEAVGTKKDRQRIVAKIRSLATNPRPPGCQKLSGANKFRVRQGSYRIVYSVDHDRLVVSIVRIGHRRDIYRRKTSS